MFFGGCTPLRNYHHKVLMVQGCLPPTESRNTGNDRENLQWKQCQRLTKFFLYMVISPKSPFKSGKNRAI